MAYEIFAANVSNRNVSISSATGTKNGPVRDHKAGRYPCTNCGKRFQKPCLLQRHESVHSAAKNFKCAECNKSFAQKSSLQRHSAQQHNGAARHRCPKCACSFAQRSNMLTHLQQVHPTITAAAPHDAHKYACDQCSCVYTKQNLLSRHKRARHADNSNATLDAEPFEGDVNALALQVLAQLKSLQSGIQHLTTAAELAEVELPPACVAKQQPVETAIVEEVVSSVVQLPVRLNAQHLKEVINVQRVRRADGVAYYVCEYCAREFRKSYDFIRHRRVHTRERPYQCGYCQRACTTRSQLRAHARIHRLDERRGFLTRQHSCPICAQNYCSMRQLDTHMRIHRETHTLRYLCNHCPSSYPTKTAFSAHKHKAPVEALQHAPANPQAAAAAEATLRAYAHRPYVCSTCAWKLPTRAHLLQHLKKHKMRHKLHCVKCNRSYNNVAAFRLHRRRCRCSQNSYSYTCAHCGSSKYYASLLQLQLHLRRCTAVRQFKCACCVRTFRNVTQCRQHMQTHLKHLLNNADSGSVDNGCMRLQQNAAHNGFVVVKEIMHRDDCSSSSSTLAYCEKWLLIETSSTRTSHSARRQPATALHTQPAATSSASLAKHKCHNCAKSFHKPSDLQRHLRIHSDEKSHACAQCHKRFRLHGTLQQHQRIHEATRRRYECQVCGKWYVAAKVLKIHLRLHTGARPFQCAICGREFRTSGHRIAHMRAAHVGQMAAS